MGKVVGLFLAGAQGPAALGTQAGTPVYPVPESVRSSVKVRVGKDNTVLVKLKCPRRVFPRCSNERLLRSLQRGL